MGYSSLIRLEKGPSDSLLIWQNLIAVFFFLTADLVKVKKEEGFGFRYGFNQVLSYIFLQFISCIQNIL